MRNRLIAFFAVLGILFLHCEVDTGLRPLQSGFGGLVTFKNEWPAETDQVIVAAATKFPPSTINDIILGEPLPINVESVRYTLYTQPQTFAAVGIVWKEKDQPWDVTNIIGIYFPTDNLYTPGQVTVPDRNTMIDTIDITADFSKARRHVESRITGKLTVKGEWPSTATAVIVAASQKLLPLGLLDITLSQPIAVPFDSVDYSFSAQPGVYPLIGVLVLEEGVPLGFESIRGIYRTDPADIFPGTVTVADDSTVVIDIDIVIDFGTRRYQPVGGDATSPVRSYR